MTLPLLAIGAIGAISVASHWVGPQLKSVLEAFVRGDLTEAIAGNARLLEAIDFQSSEDYPNPLPAKAILRALGLRVGQCRLPMGSSTDELDARAAKVLAAFGPPIATGQPVA
jgi:4-hydroxy-tetrahydrodipicolinate synthase